MAPTVAFGPEITAMATPFGTDGALDLAAAERVARWLVDQGSSAIVVTGSTGESATLSDDERATLWRVVAAAVDVPVIAGATTNDTAHSLRLVDAAERAGAKGILAVVPYYNRPPQAGLVRHFGQIARATSLPVLLYDVPARTGRRLEPETTRELARTSTNVVGLKDASGDLAAAAALVAEAPDGFVLYCGDDALVLPYLAIGAVGVVSVAGHWAGPLQRVMIEAARSGDWERARRLNAALEASYRFENQLAYPNPIPTKAMLAALGLAEPVCRSPLIDPTPTLIDEARSVLADLHAQADKEGIELRVKA
ncbi:dihydrodipicolinate synthase [Acidimicrobium ferrooxidans DSM 10331]|uniref:4-hydroxy-tetrahydrodipicolinate synthase n=1 Tax=Acidimicrobium ferrooxidans (strain DSM 10331 / JCM 15462 / NBRC 103882 / ICP) TaxID=525909 RepID=C7LXZ2_ACIFD|nr:4-hydroxy-tetrahydrodipicolinate synthase [Acidimicrobium ferrooxidans]ACU53600.1 dihydrodipicolinate synthase [Acidimicrobium ferrooxidans DSM 10331]